MSIYKGTLCFFITLFLFVTTEKSVGDDDLGVAKEMLEPILPQEYVFQYQAQNVWQTVSSIVITRIVRLKGRILVKNLNNLTISWVERISEENRQRLTTQQSLLYKNEIREVGEGGIAITTASVRDRLNGSLLRIRRVYYGKSTQPKMTHSRGSFANMFQALIDKKMRI